MAEKKGKIKGKISAAVKEFYDTVPPNRDPRMTGAKYRKYLRGLKQASSKSLITQLKNKGLPTPLNKKALKYMKNIGVFPAVSGAPKIVDNLSSKDFVQRRITLGGVGSQAAKAAKATKVGKIAAGVAAAALATKAGLEKLYEKRTGKKPFTKREKKRTLVDKKMGGGMMNKPMGYDKGGMPIGKAVGKAVKKVAKSRLGRATIPVTIGLTALGKAGEFLDKKIKAKKKMGGGLTEATRRLRAQGLKTGGSACRGMGAALRGGDFKGVK